ncbi:MAG: iron-siderophore ABC transporter substrate-binding protein [Leptolyngbya sp. SIO4C5]|nr:iron-siderophore ABC transporter substrate-binding protein [Leptolyngbya sp. SIO4C5]
MSFKAIGSVKLKSVLMGLLATIVIVACQSNLNPQPDNAQLANCRVIQHALGEACVPQIPQRLVSLEAITLADAFALGVSPIGTVTDFGQVPIHLEKYSRDFLLLGITEQPNLEKILTLNPDLIIGVDIFSELIFERLSKIAPTTLGQWNGFSSWRDHFNFVAYVLDKEDQAKNVWAQYYRRISDIKAALGDQLSEKKVAFIYAHSGMMNIDTENSFVGSIFTDIGIRQPTYIDVDWGVIPLSEELISEIDADILFVSAYGDASEQKTLVEWQQKPLWRQLKAVQAGEVYVVNSDIWKGGDPIAANLVLDDLFKYLVEKELPETVPAPQSQNPTPSSA